MPHTRADGQRSNGSEDGDRQGNGNETNGRGGDLGSGDAPAAGIGDGGQLLGPGQNPEGLRPGWPDHSDGAGSGCDSVRLDGYTAPVTRSPHDPWHSEQYLLACLVRMHGWFWLQPRVLRGPLRPNRPLPQRPEVGQ